MTSVIELTGRLVGEENKRRLKVIKETDALAYVDFIRKSKKKNSDAQRTSVFSISSFAGNWGEEIEN